VFRSDLDPAPKVVLEEAGPIRATIKADGWYTNEKGEQFCRFSIRASFYRGRSDVRLEHTFIYTGKSVEDKIVGLGVQLPQKNGLRGYYGGEGLLPPVMAGDFTSNIKLIQDSPDHHRFEFYDIKPNGSEQRRASR